VDYLIRSLSEQDQQAVNTQGKGAIANQYIQMLVLQKQALLDHLDASPDLERQVAFDRARWLARAEFMKMQDETKVTQEEIGQYYSAHSADFDQVQLRQVGIRVKPATAAATAPGLTVDEARARAAEIRQALAAGTSPQEVSKKFSVSGTVFIDANGQTFGRDKLPPNLAPAILKLKDGEMTDTQAGPQSVYFVQLVKRVHPEMKDVSSSIEAQLRQEKILAAIDQLQSKATVWSDPDFFKPPATPSASSGSAAPAPGGKSAAVTPPK
ncbi:MAG TPA: peptidylprolyl isomerase, partial [Terriglobia bacterium]|nr:peptidylprolyl isomerase [Terriglobia bacterium]